MSHEFETGYLAVKTAWHGLGYVSEVPLTATEAYTASGLAWTVEKWPAVAYNEADPAQITQLPGFGTVRRRIVDGQELIEPLGMVGPQYRVIQNDELFNFAAQLMDVSEGELIIETAGSLRSGKQVWVLARYTEDIEIAGDTIAQFLLVASSHDGSMGFTVKPTPTRVVCANTLQLSLSEIGMPTYTVRHTEGAKAKIAEAREALSVGWRYGESLEDEIATLMNQRAELVPVMDRVMPPVEIGETSERRYEYRQAARSAVRRRYEEGDARQFRGTAWGVLNAFNGWSLHERRGASDESVVAKGLDGKDRLTQQVHGILVNQR